jgi:hypothetical protein
MAGQRPKVRDSEVPLRDSAACAGRPPMVPAELLGSHEHETCCGKKVQVWKRGNSFLVRGRHEGRQFGKTVGDDPTHAASQLRHLLVSLETGSFQLPSEARRRPLQTGQAPRLDVRELCDSFLAEKRRLLGKESAADYQSRLVPLIEFSERTDSRRRWPLARDINRDFAVEFKAWLFTRPVTRNGRPSAAEKKMSPRHVFNVLDCARSLYHWARQPSVNKLPTTFITPFTKEIVGEKPRKDPLRRILIPQQDRITLVGAMDAWELSHLTLSLVLPLRPEDFSGLLVTDVNFPESVLHFGTRLGGRDFNKGRQTYSCPFPKEIAPLLQACVGGRAAGPLLRRRAVWDGGKSKLIPTSPDNLIQTFEQTLSKLAPGEVQSDQDTKRVFRRMLLEMGGVSEDGLAKAFKALLPKAGLSGSIKFYDLRSSCTTELEWSGVSHLVQRYVTGHTTKDILYSYVSLDPVGEMEKYFHSIQPLLAAITDRAKKLGLTPMAMVAAANMNSVVSNDKDLPFSSERNSILQRPAVPDSTSS